MATRMTWAQFGLAYLAVLIVVGALDAVWLGFLAKDLYKREMGDLMATSVRAVPAALFYVLYPLALVYLALWHQPSGWSEALIRSVVFGLAAFGAYDLTNMAVVRNWPIGLSLIDWAWGAFAAALAGSAGYWAAWGRS